ncbi:MAG: aldose 1-epimerase [Pseudomonadota bacterium]
MTLLSLAAGRLALELAPAAGGSVARFCVDGKDVLRAMSARAVASGKGNEAAAYPLVPYSNRIANGQLVVAGRTFHLQPNWPGVGHPMHGEGWANPWQVARQDRASADLVHEHDGRSGWPFRYRAQQSFRLEEEALTVALSIENCEAQAVPAGLGLHPFFVRNAETRLGFCARSVWLADREVLPTERVDVPDTWNFVPPRRVDDVVLDNCFEGWDGRATVTWPDRGLRIDVTASSTFRHLVVYIPPGRSYFSVEPVSHANGHVAEAMLATGAVLSGEIVFRPIFL